MIEKLIVSVLKGTAPKRIPIWFMRQAGRYLPEYKKIRLQTKNFMNAVLTPEIAAEITLQPIRRFDIDAAIIFSDILVIPYAMGINVEFHEGIGPVIEFDFNPNNPLSKINWRDSENFNDVVSKICQTISIVKENLTKSHPSTATIGFAGAPWTVTCYLLEKNRKKGGDFELTRQIAYQYPKAFKKIIDEITDATIVFLLAQIDAGAEVIKVFDSHAGLLSEHQFQSLVTEPMIKIVQAIKSQHPDIPIIGFPRKAGILYERFASETQVDCIALDHTPPLRWIKENIQKHCVVQGNLDNIYLTLDLNDAQEAISDSVTSIIANLYSPSVGRFIFNLGHGCLPETKIENLEYVINKIRNIF